MMFNKVTFLFFLVLLSLFPVLSFSKDYSDYREECDPIRKEVEEILIENGADINYFYLLVAESHCQIKTSKAGAKGYWQMMPRTARKYGCDNPEDLVCATHAASKYLVHLEQKCGKENVVYCWHDGGTNFLKKRKRVPTSGAKALNWQFKHLMQSDYLSNHVEENDK